MVETNPKYRRHEMAENPEDGFAGLTPEQQATLQRATAESPIMPEVVSEAINDASRKSRSVVWEYVSQKVLAAALPDTLNREGQRGWEAWHLDHTSDDSVQVYFKRQQQ